MKKKILALFFLGYFLVSCGGEIDNSVDQNDSKSNNKKILDKKLENYPESLLYQSDMIHVGAKNEFSYITIDKKDITFFADKKQKTVLKDTYAQKAWLSISGNYVYIFWWVKNNSHEEKLETAGKTLYVRASKDKGATFSKTVRINTAHGVLPDVHIVSDSKGHVAVAYTDERNPGYQIYTNSSSDGGITWLKKEIKIGDLPKDADEPKKINGLTPSYAVTPRLNKVGGKLIITWEQNNLFNKKMALRLLSRSSSDFGKSWGEVEEIYRSYHQSSMELETAVVKNKLILMAVTNQGLVAFVKNPDKAWSQVEGLAPNTDKAKLVSYIKTASGDNKLYVTYVYVGEGRGKKAWHSELTRLNLKTLKWEEGSYRFDKMLGKGAFKNRSGYQDIATLDDGSIIVIWEDFRSILPAIFINYSKDEGVTWLEKPYSLSILGGESAAKPVLKSSSSEFNVFFNVFVLKDETRPVVTTRRVILPSPKKIDYTTLGLYEYKVKDKASQEKKLASRMKKLMAARLKGDLEEEWKFLDPIYRNQHRKLSWMANRELLKFTDYTIKKIDVTGDIGSVKGKMSSRFTSKFEEAESLNKQRKEMKDYDMKWGWFKDQWYMIPENPLKSYLP